RLRARHEGLCGVPLGGGIELVPDRGATRGDDILDACRRARREDLQVVSDLRRSGGGDFAVRVEGLLAADRSEDDRRVVSYAEDVDAHVDLDDVDPPAVAQQEFQDYPEN